MARRREAETYLLVGPTKVREQHQTHTRIPQGGKLEESFEENMVSRSLPDTGQMHPTAGRSNSRFGTARKGVNLGVVSCSFSIFNLLFI